MSYGPWILIYFTVKLWPAKRKCRICHGRGFLYLNDHCPACEGSGKQYN